ncbi:AAA family ATPase [candidate division WOR-1 bacterium RIFOXYA12_FULL_43_27]|uniref:AAA family ATPase n=1 Tax=candidate division WOR-1 bacterium RIFOXYC2_FULL_46_14 TaxID=1802587 RepID=A0A1F4U401_UNCSA|nr:MAG: AAA family ATPase [candidate division WOR-1 bacterium RIFOXYA12_FULL_43_27]OGC20053.1 MAG: AAA family ATPase [candidate division WOR-1 bacterium RIFOXYB2_FULL_46_45]OGC32211.1 MAG: AAA family ATPase [candidate division WOR-1 bacterium RIFOXYA2_FULL_46_56]OGC39611.1 MAG: AAA family ATPase [candidate division WOR-1 bacterium RIFOXYC2_FULL_46_14]
MPVELNELFKKSLCLIENTGKNVFITGKAGTGKSTLLDYFRNQTKKRVVVLAPTGVAAINVGGETIHSFFHFKPDITLSKIREIKFRDGKPNIYKQLDAIVIDEISMVRADLLDCVDKFLRLNGPNRKKPFGGLQMIFFGDLYQLPPVVAGEEKHIFKNHYDSEYFFSAKVFGQLTMEYLELEKVYRQRDEKFIALLNSIRNNTAGENELLELNRRVDVDYEPKGDYSILLTTTNRMAKEMNEIKLEQLPGKERVFEGEMEGQFDRNQLPTEIELKLKKGAQVMMLNNDQFGRWVNGTMAKIKDIKKDELVIQLQSGETHEVNPYTWEIFHFSYNTRNRRIESEVTASFTQFPLKLAWAITIHKSQGKTFDRVVIDIGNGTFAHGQMYVALSRCRSLEGMVLKKPIKKGHIFMDWRVVKFVTGYQYGLSEKLCSLDDKVAIITKAIEEKNRIEVLYLKAQDVKSKRVIEPLEVGEMYYNEKPFLGIRAFCHHRQEERVFRVDRILEMRVV